MGDALLLARAVLAVVFVAAGLAKVADRAGTRQAMTDFGLPRVLARPLSLVLPVAEFSVAVALLAPAFAWWGAVGALGLLGAFSLAIGLALTRGRRPACHCFGALHSAAIGRGTLLRNLALSGIATFIVVAGGHDPGSSSTTWAGALSPSAQVGLLVGGAFVALAALGAWFATSLLAQQGRILLRLDALEAILAGNPLPERAGRSSVASALGLPVGSPAPGFAVPGIHGDTLTLEALRAPGLPILLLFTDPECGPCNALLPEVGRWQHDHAGRITLAVISRGSVETNRAKASELGLRTVLLQEGNEVAQAYRYGGTPSAVVIDPDGRIGSHVAGGAEAIRALVARVIGVPIPLPVAPPTANGRGYHQGQDYARQGLAVDQAAPNIALPDPAGKNVDLAFFRGRSTLLIFWNPGCGFCQKMLPNLQAWEAAPPPGAPALVVVSTGSAEDHADMALRSAVILDSGGAAMHAFGVVGTPMAVLVNEEGRIASAVVAGETEIWELVKRASDGLPRGVSTGDRGHR